jgi:maleylpyruvate isomerase
MTQQASAPDAGATRLTELRGLVQTATSRLLGDTIRVTDDQWRSSSRLPAWTRGHLAAHLARHADALMRLTAWARSGERHDMYASSQQRDSEIEEGSTRDGLDLQIDLDTTSGQLEEAFDSLSAVDAWDAEVEMRGGLRTPARLLPLARLTEVVIHHVDLDVGYEVDDIDETTAAWLLEWSAFRLRHRDEFPRLNMTSDTGLQISIGSSGGPLAVRGTNARLLGWLTSRAAPSTVDGSDGLHLPPF